LNDPFELPSLEQIGQMDKQRSQALQSLQITDNSVKCQRCGMDVPILRMLTKPRSNQIDTLVKQIKWIENHSRGNNAKADGNIKQLKAELADYG
jgi:hypothetical protein